MPRFFGLQLFCNFGLFEIKRIGKNIVFIIPIKLIPEFWRKQEIPEKFWKRYKEVKPDFLLFIPDLPSRALTNHPTILLDILCLANLNEILFFLFH